MVRDGGQAWRFFKEFGDTLGEAIIQGLLAMQAVAGMLRRPRGLFLVAAMIGGLSPLTGGLGNSVLSKSGLVTWVPVGALPAMVALLWFLRRSLWMLNREGERDASRRQRERPHPGVDKQLSADARRRSELNAKLGTGKNLPFLEEANFCHDILTDSLRRIRARFGNRDIALVLERFTKKRGFKLVDVKGSLDREAEVQLELGRVEGHDVERLLADRLAGLQYRHKAVEFSIGHRRYLLLAISGATIPEDVHAEISEAAVLLVEEYVWAARSLDSMTGQA